MTSMTLKTRSSVVSSISMMGLVASLDMTVRSVSKGFTAQLFWLVPLVCLHTCLAQVIVTSYAALGDSYPAGIGAGSLKLFPPADPFCSQHSDSYPLQVAEDYRIAVQDVKHLACGGAVSSGVLLTQVPRIGRSDVVTIQVGGNEADFFRVLNECIQQWYPVSTCKDELLRARKIIQAPEMLDSFGRLVTGAQKSSGPQTAVIMLGYARFFNDQADGCKNVSFSKRNPENLLTVKLRKEINNLVLLLNEMIRGVAEAHGVTYLDIDSAFEGHRFCEEGVTKPTAGSSWFFNDFIASSYLEADRTERRDSHQLRLSSSSRGFENLARTFHPTSEGHGAIANAIVELLVDS